MDAKTDGLPPTRTRKRKDAQTPLRPSSPKKKCTILLPPDVSLRLTVHAESMGLDRSELVARLIRLHCRRFVVQDRGGREDLPGAEGEGPAGAGEGEGGAGP